MKCFVTGAIGALLVLIIAVGIGTQYSDYRARAETGGWLIQVQALQSAIEQKAIRQKSLVGAGNDIDKKALQIQNLDTYEITESGIIILQGGSDGQLLALIPSLSDGKVVWRCMGGSAHAMPEECKKRPKPA